MQIRQCKKCTYPLRDVWITDTFKMTICSNRSCDYYYTRKIKKKKYTGLDFSKDEYIEMINKKLQEVGKRGNRP